MSNFFVPDEQGWQTIAAELVSELRTGDVVFLMGEMGVGKTSLARAIIRSYGHVGPVRSPTYPIYILYPLTPPVLHADLYRLEDLEGTDLEEAMDGCISLVEWPERVEALAPHAPMWRIHIEECGEGRQVSIDPPSNRD